MERHSFVQHILVRDEHANKDLAHFQTSLHLHHFAIGGIGINHKFKFWKLFSLPIFHTSKPNSSQPIFVLGNVQSLILCHYNANTSGRLRHCLVWFDHGFVDSIILIGECQDYSQVHEYVCKKNVEMQYDNRKVGKSTTTQFSNSLVTRLQLGAIMGQYSRKNLYETWEHEKFEDIS